MFSSKKKFYLIILIVAVVIVFLFIKEWERAKQIIVQHKALPIISTFLIDIPVETDDQIFGNPGAPITIVEFNDLNCLDCLKQHQVIYNLVEKNPSEVRLIWKDAPQKGLFTNINPTAHLALYCAGEQNKFWPYLQTLTAKEKNWTQADLSATAVAQNINLDTWTTCLSSDKAQQKIQASINLAWDIGLREMPGIFINNQKINLDKNIDLQEVLETLIQK